MASSHNRPTCAASCASESMVSGMPRVARRAEDVRRRIHDAGRIADAVGVELERARRTRPARPARRRSHGRTAGPAGVPRARCSRSGRGCRSGRSRPPAACRGSSAASKASGSSQRGSARSDGSSKTNPSTACTPRTTSSNGQASSSRPARPRCRHVLGLEPEQDRDLRVPRGDGAHVLAVGRPVRPGATHQSSSGPGAGEMWSAMPISGSPAARRRASTHSSTLPVPSDHVVWTW